MRVRETQRGWIHIYLHETLQKQTSRLSRVKLLTHLQLISIKNKIETLQSGTLPIFVGMDDRDEEKKKNDIREKKGEEKPQDVAAAEAAAAKA